MLLSSHFGFDILLFSLLLRLLLLTIHVALGLAIEKSIQDTNVIDSINESGLHLGTRRVIRLKMVLFMKTLQWNVCASNVNTDYDML